MTFGRAEWPEPGELVVVTVTRIVPYGAYVVLDEYGGKEGLVHISEISSRWVKNIKDHIREGQKTVLKVLRISTERGQVDLSLRRVAGNEKREKLMEWKHERRSMELIRLVAEKMGVGLDEAYEKVGLKIQDFYGNIYAGLEEASEQGEKALIRAGVSPDWAKSLTEQSQAYIRVPRFKVKGILTLNCIKPKGVEAIKDAIKQAMKTVDSKNAKIQINLIGSPKYRVEVLAKDYKKAEELMVALVDNMIKNVEASGGEGTFQRES